MIHNLHSDDKKLKVNIEMLPSYNFALQQNGINYIQQVVIENHTGKYLRNLKLDLISTSEMIIPFSKMIDAISESGIIELNDAVLNVDAEQLAQMTERFVGNLQVKLSLESEIIVDEIIPITILAYDEWQGAGIYPEFLTAFVMPNNPEIVQIIHRASELLGNWTGDPSFDAYQSKDPNQVMKQAAAIYESIKHEEITYCVAPASFETVGQRVRLSDAIISQKLGNCLDLTLLYTAALEAAGLNSLIILTENHAFAGVWLEEKTYRDAAFDDASLVTGLFADGIGEITVVECTSMVNGKDIPFDRAVAVAKEHFYDSKAITCIIDVKRSRLCNIHPIPRRVLTEAGWKVDFQGSKDILAAAAPAELSAILDVQNIAEQKFTKKTQWERKLLDLGLRNSLINMRMHSVVPFLSASVDELENAISAGKDLSITPKPAMLKIGDADKFETINIIGDFGSLLAEELKNGRVHSTFTEGELNVSLKNLYRSAKTALEESGANTLYLAVGLLKWYETARSTKPRYAPLVMIPVEMVRKSASSGYVIRVREEEPQINITLLEKLKQDYKLTINGLDPLPLDEFGINTRAVFTIIRKAVIDLKNWDVLESAYLGNFSFTQFVMWNDIRNRSDDLEKNLIVKSLIDGKLAWEAEEMLIGNDVDEENVRLPLPADASQLYAIDSACKGKSFVLHGPPGTGKSQTITAIIFNALACGKRVLFVAEKMAALEVVQRRLNEIGIGEFCLELHSNKSVKRTILDRLNAAAEVVKTVSNEEYSRKANSISKIREELSQYTSALHEKQISGLSVFELINKYDENEKAPEIAPFSKEFVRNVTPIRLDEYKMIISRLISAAEAVGHPKDHPLSVIKETHYSQELRFALPDLITQYATSLNSFIKASKELKHSVNELSFLSRDDCYRSSEVARLISLWAELPSKWASDEQLFCHVEEIIKICQHSRVAEADYNKLSDTWSIDFFELNGKELLQEYRANESKWGPIKLICQHRLLKKISPYAKQQIKSSELNDILLCLLEYQTENEAAMRLKGSYACDIALYSDAEKTNWDKLEEDCRLAKESATRLTEIAGNDNIRLKYCASADIIGLARDVKESFEGLNTNLESVNSKLKLNFDDSNWLSNQQQFCVDFQMHSSELKEWIAWNAVVDETISAGLINVADAYRNGLAHDSVFAAYMKAFTKAAIMDAVDNNDILSSFSGAIFSDRIRQFKELDKEMTRLTRQEVRCKLAANTPNMTREAAQSSEIGILQRAIRNGGRGLSIRKLFDQIPNLLPRLCPCMLMSPISVAQYLDPAQSLFDIVVFDEASQLPTCKAVGAIARGKSAVIVGDPKQMPPTSFFMTNSVDEENIELEDMESILDDCLAVSMPETHLLWHYRSRHESLIAFSNQEFYENKLYTFPSVNDRERKVSLVHVDGKFEHGKSRYNKKEAKAVVDEIIRRYNDPELSKFTIGVVTFNVNQQELIDDLLTDEYRKDPELEKWASKGQEPLFIKNLENVQGDERDVILFSVAYGPDDSGKVSMNFGPLNREGGWRRLNVAVSRARCEMIVYATITPDQINLNRSNARGVRELKEFLKFAAGSDTTRNTSSVSGENDFETGIIDSICETLKKNGYDTDKLVGHSEYRIDIGVVDPRNTENYILGILLDGDTYSNTKSVRDRELGQISVLEGLGWKALRIWSMDWWDNKEKEFDRIIKELDRLTNENEDIKISGGDSEECEPVYETISQSNLEGNYDSLFGDQQSLDIEKEWPIETYKKAELKYMIIDPNQIIDFTYERQILTRMNDVIKVEAPICEKLLFRRVAQSFGISRVGSRIQTKFEKIACKLPARMIEEDLQKIYWSLSQDMSAYYKIRKNDETENARDIREICTQERVNALCYVLDCQISLSQDDLLREAAKVMDFTRMGVNVQDAFTKAISMAVQQKLIELDANEHYRLSSKGLEYAGKAKGR